MREKKDTFGITCKAMPIGAKEPLIKFHTKFGRNRIETVELILAAFLQKNAGYDAGADFQQRDLDVILEAMK